MVIMLIGNVPINVPEVCIFCKVSSLEEWLCQMLEVKLFNQVQAGLVCESWMSLCSQILCF